MTAYLIPLILIGGLISTGVYLLLERTMTRMLLGLLLIGNAVNLLILSIGGDPARPPIRGYTSAGRTGTADPLAQAMVLTSIVISMGVAAFVLALIYRAYRLTTREEVPDDPEDTRVSQLSASDAPALPADRVTPATVRGDQDSPAELDAVDDEDRS